MTTEDEDRKGWGRLAEEVDQKKRKLEVAQEEYNLAKSAWEQHPLTKRQRTAEAETKEEQERQQKVAANKAAIDRQTTEWWSRVSQSVDEEANHWLLYAQKVRCGAVRHRAHTAILTVGLIGVVHRCCKVQYSLSSTT